jgi:hypothetical protein
MLVVVVNPESTDFKPVLVSCMAILLCCKCLLL